MSKTIDVGAALELIRAAQMNLDNLAAGNPGVSRHPFFQIVKFQLGEAVVELDPPGVP